MLRGNAKIPAAKINDWHIIRDDLLDGGTKRRALLKYLPSLRSDRFIYAGSVYGSGGWALAEACRDLGFHCTLALSKADYRPAWLDRIKCDIEWFEPQPVAQIRDSLKGRNTLLPLGYDDADFITCLAGVFHEADITAPEIWLPCASGVFVRAAQLAWPHVQINAVCVAKRHGDLGRAVKYQAPEKYHQRARHPPPYPANPFSDAKLWSFAGQFALKDAVIWNTSA